MSSMKQSELEKLLAGVADGKTSVADALVTLKGLPFVDLGFAKLDNHRTLRCGFPEVIYTPGKTIKQLRQIVKERLSDSELIVLTKASPEIYEEIKSVSKRAEYNDDAQVIVIRQGQSKEKTGLVLVVSAGTTDIPVAEEAALVAELMDASVKRIFDIGVAGVHRTFAFLDDFKKARVIVAVAGMEGALPSLIGGIVSCPVIAVPTSIGYGTSYGGIAALLGMLNTCAPGVSVVNIDNGFGAGYIAGVINKMGNTKT